MSTKDYIFVDVNHTTDVIMKRAFLLLLFTILSLSNVHAQLVKDEMVEDDGFVWYKIHYSGDGNSYGAEDQNHKTLIPTKRGYSLIYYNKYEKLFRFWKTIKQKRSEGVCDLSGKEIISAEKGYDFVTYRSNDNLFDVERNGKKGICGPSGEEIISPDRGYEKILCYTESEYYLVERNGKGGVCDGEGKEIISPDRGYDYVGYYVFYYKVKRDGKEGACDLSGKELLPPQYASVFYDKRFGKLKYEDEHGNWIDYSSDGNQGQSASTKESLTASIQSPTTTTKSPEKTDYVPPTPVFDGYYTMTGVYKSGGQWFNTGITSLTYFRVYRDEMYEGRGTYAYYYVGNETLDNTSFRRYGTNNDDYFLVTFSGLVRRVTAFSANYPMLGTVRTVNVNYYDQGDTRSAYTQSYNSGGNYSESTSGSSSTSTGAGTHRCGLCEGKGWIPTDEGVSSYGSTAERWCDGCRKYVVTNHWHKPCPSCGGKGYW